jgi:hypothetical protein
MGQKNGQRKTTLQQAGEDLFNYAIDRQDTKWLLARLHPQANVKPAKVEYELQILKIITVGWSIAYYLEHSAQKNALAELFWQSINQFSSELSETTGLLIGQDIDYFKVLKERLHNYVQVLNSNPQATEPARVIGPEFARLCGDETDLFAFMTGSKMFISVIERVKQYLEKVKLLQVH